MKQTRYYLEEYPMALILLVQVVMVCMGVIFRYAVKHSFSFTEEMTRFLLVWLACLGFSACWGWDEMIRFRWPGERSKIVNRIFYTISIAASFFFAAILCYTSIKMVRFQWMFNQTTTVMGWPIAWVSVGLPVGCLLLIYRLFFTKPRKLNE